MIRIKILLFAILNLVSPNPFHLKRDILLPTKTIDRNGMSFNSIGLYFSKTKTNHLIDFAINFNSDVTILADKEHFDWGVDCSLSNDCQVTNEDTEEDYAYNVQYYYKNAQAYIRPSSDTYATDQKLKALDIRLMEKTNEWMTKGWGLIGFGPQGDFANYIRALYEENFKILFYFYRSNDHHSHYDYVNYSVIAPTIEKKNYIDKIKLSSSDKYWNVYTHINLGEKSIAHNAQTCLTNFGNDILYLLNADQFCEDIQRLICDGKYGSECTKDIADLSKAPKLTITIQEKKYEITHKHYIKNTKNNKVECRFGQIFNLRGSMNCAPGAEFGLSKGFFEIFVPIIEFKTDGSSQIIFLKKYVIPQSINTGLWIIIVGGAASIAIAILVYMLAIRKSQDSDEEIYYAINE